MEHLLKVMKLRMLKLGDVSFLRMLKLGDVSVMSYIGSCFLFRHQWGQCPDAKVRQNFLGNAVAALK